MNRPVVLLAILLLLFPAALISYRVLALGYPLFPAAPGTTWRLTMEARILEAADEDAVFQTALPYTRPGLRVIEEQITSGTLSLSLLRAGRSRIGIWSGPILGGMEVITYRAAILVGAGYSPLTFSLTLPPYPENIGQAEQNLAERLAARSQVAGSVECGCIPLDMV